MEEGQREQRQHQSEEQGADYNSAIIPYITAMAMAGKMLDNGTITRKVFFLFEEKMLQKYKLSPHSLYRDLHLLYSFDQR